MSIFRINNGLSAQESQRRLLETQLGKNLQSSFQKLSSGLRINRAADDAAGMSVASRLQAQINGLNEAFSNTQQGINLANIADQGLGSATSSLDRIRELALQAGSPALGKSDRRIIQNEINQLVDEVGRVAETTQYGSTRLLNGDRSPTAGIRPGTDDLGASIDDSDLTTRENFLNITRVQEGSSTITADDPTSGTQITNTGIQNVQDVAISQGTFETGAGTATSTENLTNTTFNNVDLQNGGEISFRGVLADGETEFTGTFQISAASDIAGGNGASTSLADAIQQAINEAETAIGVDSAGGTNAEETNVSFNDTTGRLEFANGAEQGVSDFNVDFSVSNATGDLQNRSGSTRATELGGEATGAQVGNAVNAITGNTFATGELTIEISAVVEAQERTVQSTLGFEQAGGVAADANTELIGAVFNGVTLAAGDTFTIRGSNADGSTFDATFTVSTLETGAGDGAAVTVQDFVDELNVRDQSLAAGGIGEQSGFTDATASLNPDGRIQLTDDVATTSQTDFTLSFNDLSDSGNSVTIGSDLVREGTEQRAVVSINDGPSQTVTAGEEVTLFGAPVRGGEEAPQLTLRLGDDLSVGSDTINTVREEFVGSLNGGEQVRFSAGEQDVQFASGIRPGESLTLDFDASMDVPRNGQNQASTIYISATGQQANFQIGANAGDTLATSFGDIRPGSLGAGVGRTLEDIDVTAEGGVNEALAIVDAALSRINDYRGEIGAITNRLESTATNLSVSSENMLAANSRIMDTDFALETSNLIKNQLLMQFNIGVQSQANQITNAIFLELMR